MKLLGRFLPCAGACLCGGIRYEYAGEIAEVSLCHCSMCRKTQGSAYAAVSPLDASRLRIVKGRELLKEFRAVPCRARVFCSNCGSPVYSARDDLPGVVRLRLGTVETPFRCDNTYHIFVASKAEWETIADDLPRFSGFAHLTRKHPSRAARTCAEFSRWTCSYSVVTMSGP